ncbi:MAG: hypothetical protein V3T59_07580 [Desulfobacterales bacterium]
MVKTMHLSAGLALALGRMDQAVNLVTELAPALSSSICGSPTRVKFSQQLCSEVRGQNR